MGNKRFAEFCGANKVYYWGCGNGEWGKYIICIPAGGPSNRGNDLVFEMFCWEEKIEIMFFRLGLVGQRRKFQYFLCFLVLCRLFANCLDAYFVPAPLGWSCGFGSNPEVDGDDEWKDDPAWNICPASKVVCSLSVWDTLPASLNKLAKNSKK